MTRDLGLSAILHVEAWADRDAAAHGGMVEAVLTPRCVPWRMMKRRPSSDMRMPETCAATALDAGSNLLWGWHGQPRQPDDTLPRG